MIQKPRRQIEARKHGSQKGRKARKAGPCEMEKTTSRNISEHAQNTAECEDSRTCGDSGRPGNQSSK